MQHHSNHHLRLRSQSPLISALLLLLVFQPRFLGTEITNVPEGTAKHAAILKPSPTITQLARQMRVSGRVEVAVEITEEGCVRKTKVLSGNPLLAESVIIAVKAWKFQPFLQSGKQIPVATVLSFDFKQ